MDKSATLNLRVNPKLKKDAENILKRLGVPMSTAVDMFLNQIVLVGGIPFAVTLPDVPESIDATKMNEDQIHAKIQKGIIRRKGSNRNGEWEILIPKVR